LDTTVAFDHVTPFAGRPAPESRNGDTYKVTISAGIDYRLAVMKNLRVFFCHDQRSLRSSHFSLDALNCGNANTVVPGRAANALALGQGSPHSARRAFPGSWPSPCPP
jgi:hypothetical protein